MRKVNKGFTLIEIIIVLLVISVLVFFGLYLKKTISTMIKNHQLESDITLLSTATTSWKMNNDITKTPISLKSVCASFEINDRVCKDNKTPWGGEYYVKRYGTTDKVLVGYSVSKELAKDHTYHSALKDSKGNASYVSDYFLPQVFDELNENSTDADLNGRDIVIKGKHTNKYKGLETNITKGNKNAIK